MNIFLFKIQGIGNKVFQNSLKRFEHERFLLKRTFLITLINLLISDTYFLKCKPRPACKFIFSEFSVSYGSRRVKNLKLIDLIFKFDLC